MAPSVIIRCNKVPLHIFQFKYIALRWKESKIDQFHRIGNFGIWMSWDDPYYQFYKNRPNSVISATIYAIFIDKDTQYRRLMWYVPILNLGQFLSRAKTQFPGSLMSGHWVKSQDLKTTCEERTKRKGLSKGRKKHEKWYKQFFIKNMYSFEESLAWWTVPSEERGAHQGCDEEARFLDHFHYLFVIRICVS